jgi:hypothetical protein
MSRVLRPTGMCVIVWGRDKTQTWNIATALQQSLEPAFRWTSALQVASEQSCRGHRNDAHKSRWARYLRILNLSRLALKIRFARLRSTLAICALAHGELLRVCENYAWCATAEQFAPEPAPQPGSPLRAAFSRNGVGEGRLSLAQHGAAGGVLGKWRIDTSPVGTTDVPAHALAPGRQHRLLSMSMRLMFRPDLVLVLTSSGHREISNIARGQRNCLPALVSHSSVSYLNGSLSIEESVYEASRVILQWLSTRQGRRLSPEKGPSTPWEAPFSENRAELHDLQCRKAE